MAAASQGDRCHRPAHGSPHQTPVRISSPSNCNFSHNALYLFYRASRIRVTSDVIFPGQQGPQIIAADIGDPDVTRHRPFMSRTKSHISLVRSRASSNAPLPIPMTPPPLPNDELKTTMRRLSKMVLAGYGGATLLFFGLSPESFGAASKPRTAADILTSSDSIAREKTEEEAKLTCAGAVSQTGETQG